MNSGKPLEELFTVRSLEIPDPSEYNAKTVRQTRARLHISQALFCPTPLGVSGGIGSNTGEQIPFASPAVLSAASWTKINRDPEGFSRSSHRPNCSATLKGRMNLRLKKFSTLS